MSRGKDEFYIKVSDLQLITRKKKSALLAIAENLKDMLGNTLRSPTGRILYKRYTCIGLCGSAVSCHIFSTCAPAARPLQCYSAASLLKRESNSSL
jgi:hypothetical protein